MALIVSTMDQNWPSQQNFYPYYPPHDPSRQSDRQPNHSPPIATHSIDNGGGPSDSHGNSHHRRSYEPSHHGGSSSGGGGASFLPPPPPPHTHSTSAGGGGGGSGAGSHHHHHGASSMNLPPFASTFYSAGGSSYHSPTQSHPGSSQSAPIHLPHTLGGYGGGSSGGGSGHVPMGAPPPGSYTTASYPMSSPVGTMASTSSVGNSGGGGSGRIASHGGLPPPHSYNESPRLAGGLGGGGGYSSSPTTRHLSPTSPTTHLAPPIGGPLNTSTGSSSTSSFASLAHGTRTPANMTKSKRRHGSITHSSESWDENDVMKSGGTSTSKGDYGEMPWGMPQDEYKALNPKDKKQVRNRIGARRFRAKRKDYVSNLEGTLHDRENEIAQLRGQVEAQRGEINDLRHRLGMPLVPPPPEGGLGLVVEGDGWSTQPMKGERKQLGE